MILLIIIFYTIGKYRVTLVPFPYSDEYLIFPPCASTISYIKDTPKPDPLGLVVKNGSFIFFSVSF